MWGGTCCERTKPSAVAGVRSCCCCCRCWLLSYCHRCEVVGVVGSFMCVWWGCFLTHHCFLPFVVAVAVIVITLVMVIVIGGGCSIVLPLGGLSSPRSLSSPVDAMCQVSRGGAEARALGDGGPCWMAGGDVTPRLAHKGGR